MKGRKKKLNMGRREAILSINVIDLFCISIQFEVKDVIPCSARTYRSTYHFVPTTRTKQFHALLKAMHVFVI